MTTRRLPRSFRGRALPRSASDQVTWPPALRGRPPLLCLVLLGWLGGGLLATAVATVTVSSNDLALGLVHTTLAAVGLVLLMVLPAEGASRRARRWGHAQSALPLEEPLPVRLPAQADPRHDRRRHDRRRQPAPH